MKVPSRRARRAMTGGISLAALLSATPALAQTTAANPPTEGLQEIIVTAQKRAENLQSVPVTITALTGSTLANGGISDTTDLQVAVPGLVTAQLANALIPYIRGVGSNNPGAGIESSVAIYLDGVYQGAKANNILDLVSIERIEVLKGPQGTLFGRNATGGAINIVTRAPSHDPSMSAELGYGRFNEKSARVYATLGITDTLAASIAFSGKWHDGWIRNIAHNNKRANPLENEIAMGKLYWTPNDRLTVDLSASYSYVNDPTFAAIHVSPGTMPSAAALDGLTTTKSYETASTADTLAQSAETIRSTLKVSYDLGGADLVSISGYVKGDLLQIREADVSPLRLQLLHGGGFSEQYSQEVQLQSHSGGPLSWIVGAYYIRLDEGLGKPTYTIQSGTPARVSPADLVAGTSIVGMDTRNDTEGYSAFGQATYAFTPSTRLTAGLRWSHEKKTATGEQYRIISATGVPEDSYIFGNGVVLNDGLIFTKTPLATRNLSKSWTKPTWRLALDHDFTDRIMGYVSYSRGFKSGGFNPAPVNPIEVPVDPEILDAFEVGVKSELFDRRLRLNGSAFYYKYDDIQVTAISGAGTGILENAAKARLFGFDVDFTAVPTDRLTIRGGMSYLDSKYKKYTSAQLILPNVVGVPCAAQAAQIDMTEARRLSGLPQSGGNCTYRFDASGQDLVIAPRFTANVGMDYELPIDGGSRLFLTGSLYHNSGYDTQPGGFFAHVGPFQTVTAAISWFAPDDRYFIRVWGENLTGDTHVEYILPSLLSFQEVSTKPRRYGVTLGFKFGK